MLENPLVYDCQIRYYSPLFRMDTRQQSRSTLTVF